MQFANNETFATVFYSRMNSMSQFETIKLQLHRGTTSIFCVPTRIRKLALFLLIKRKKENSKNFTTQLIVKRTNTNYQPIPKKLHYSQ